MPVTKGSFYVTSTARADGVLSQSFHGHSHTLTLHGRTQHMVTSARVMNGVVISLYG